MMYKLFEMVPKRKEVGQSYDREYETTFKLKETEFSGRYPEEIIDQINVLKSTDSAMKELKNKHFVILPSFSVNWEGEIS